jgi:hypothetical protein
VVRWDLGGDALDDFDSGEFESLNFGGVVGYETDGGAWSHGVLGKRGLAETSILNLPQT